MMLMGGKKIPAMIMEKMAEPKIDNSELMKQSAMEMISAVESKDAEKFAAAFKAMFQALELEPHEENEEYEEMSEEN